jgi:hypothetical protein
VDALMPALVTSAAVIARAGVEQLPAYSDVTEITDAPGFAVRREYPPDSDLAQVVNAEDQQLIKALIQFIVPAPSASAGVSPVLLRAWVFPRHKAHKLFAALHELPPNDPDAPTPNSLQRWRRARKPEHVEIIGEFFYDANEDRFFNVRARQSSRPRCWIASTRRTCARSRPASSGNARQRASCIR